MKAYSDRYQWRWPVNDYVIGHHDGRISLAILWDGLHMECWTSEERVTALEGVNQTFLSLPDDILVERHLWRRPDPTPAQAYYNHHKKAIRCHTIAERLRRDMANHHIPLGSSNKVAVVLSRPLPKKGGGVKQFKYQERAAQDLLDDVQDLLDSLPGAKLATFHQFGHLVQWSTEWDMIRQGAVRDTDLRFHLNEQWCASKPTYDPELGFFKAGDSWMWVGLMDLYPDEVDFTWPDWLTDSSGIELHLVQIYTKGDKNKSVGSAEKIENKESGGLNQIGRTFLMQKLKDTVNFAGYLAQTGVQVLENTYILKVVSHESDVLQRVVNGIKKELNASGARVQCQETVQWAAYRWSHPGMGYARRWKREDASDMVCAMAPWQTHHPGTGVPEILRLSAQNQLTLFHYRPGAPNHTMVAGKTRSGKGVETQLQILETYPLGMDSYVIEAGGSFRWPIKGLGGRYIKIDPDRHVINPFPEYELVTEVLARKRAEGEDTDVVVPTALAGPTIESLAIILTGGYSKFKDVQEGNHHESRAYQALEATYKNPAPNQKAPTFLDYLYHVDLLREEAMEAGDERSEKSFRFLYENIESFVSKPSGQRFMEAEDNLDLSGDLIGIDILDLQQTQDQQLFDIYLSVLFLRLSHKVVATRRPARLYIDEYHLPSKLAPELTAALTSIAVRMWAKENGSLCMLSQGAEDVNVDKSVLDNITHKQFMYMENGEEALAEMFKIPAKSFHEFKAFQDPGTYPIPYRQAIRVFGDRAYNLHITMPDWVLHLGETGPEDLDLKEEIETEFDGEFDMFTMLAEFARRKAKSKEKELEPHE